MKFVRRQLKKRCSDGIDGDPFLAWLAVPSLAALGVADDVWYGATSPRGLATHLPRSAYRTAGPEIARRKFRVPTKMLEL